MRPYKELRWPRFWPFLRVVDEMPSHRLRLPWVSFRKFRVPRSNKWYIRGGNPVLDGLVVGIGIGRLWFSTRGFFPAPPRKASNYIARIIIRRDVLRDESWVLQQEIYESRYWLAHPWRLVDFVTIWLHRNNLGGCERCRKAAAHLARVECWSRQQEIRARFCALYGEYWLSPPDRNPSRKEVAEMVMAYAKSIVSAKNYAYFSAAGWSEMDAYNEIVKHL